MHTISRGQKGIYVSENRFGVWILRSFILVSFLAMLYGIKEAYNAYISTKWPSVVGTIECSWTTVQPTKPKITYRYSVKGNEFTGNKIAFRDVVGTIEAKRAMHLYPVGKTVKVYYDPKDPYKSILEPGTNGVWVWLTIPEVFLFIGIVGYIKIKRKGVIDARSRLFSNSTNQQGEKTLK